MYKRSVCLPASIRRTLASDQKLPIRRRLPAFRLTQHNNGGISSGRLSVTMGLIWVFRRSNAGEVSDRNSSIACRDHGSRWESARRIRLTIRPKSTQVLFCDGGSGHLGSFHSSRFSESAWHVVVRRGGQSLIGNSQTGPIEHADYLAAIPRLLS